jgi:hypothetical protein
MHISYTRRRSKRVYTLPKEIQQVRQIFIVDQLDLRTGNGTGGTVFEPFNLAYTNTYLLSSTNMGGLVNL